MLSKLFSARVRGEGISFGVPGHVRLLPQMPERDECGTREKFKLAGIRHARLTAHLQRETEVDRAQLARLLHVG